MLVCKEECVGTIRSLADFTDFIRWRRSWCWEELWIDVLGHIYQTELRTWLRLWFKPVCLHQDWFLIFLLFLNHDYILFQELSNFQIGQHRLYWRLHHLILFRRGVSRGFKLRDIILSPLFVHLNIDFLSDWAKRKSFYVHHSCAFLQFYFVCKHRWLLLSDLLSVNQNTIVNDTVQLGEKCALLVLDAEKIDCMLFGGSNVFRQILV